MPALLVLVACPDAACADALARALVEDRHAACVQVLPGVRSTYRWEGAVEQADEVLLLAKTATAAWPGLRDAVAARHPYAVPEILALPATDGLPAYLAWLARETRPAPADAGPAPAPAPTPRSPSR